VINPGIKLGTETVTRVESSEKFILGVGALKERKGYHIAMKAFAQISNTFPDLKYRIVADQDKTYRSILDKIIKEKKLEGRVEFLSEISDEKLAGLYSRATIFVLTPINTADIHFEGFGLVYLEAARAGVPVIGTKGTGAEDAIKDGYNGILVPQNDIGKTAEAMKTILSNKDDYQKMSLASYDWARLNSIENEVAKFLAIYKD
jgi:phosphatidyl-myo-inositol dimannoside synthase